MTADEFAKKCKQERDSLLGEYFDDNSETHVSTLIKSLNLPVDQKKVLREIVGAVLTDAYFSLLVAIDGGASLSGDQQTYELRDESGSLIAGEGELEVAAFAYFHGDDDWDAAATDT